MKTVVQIKYLLIPIRVIRQMSPEKCTPIKASKQMRSRHNRLGQMRHLTCAADKINLILSSENRGF